MRDDSYVRREATSTVHHPTAGDLALRAGDLTAEEAAVAAHHCGLDRTLGGFFAALAHLGTGGVGRDLGPGGIGGSHVRILLEDGRAILVARADSGREPLATAATRRHVEQTDARFAPFQRGVDRGDEHSPPDRTPDPIPAGPSSERKAR